MGNKYRVLVGINYPPDDRRAEVGDVVDDLPDYAVEKLVAAGIIEPAGDDKPQQKTAEAPAAPPAEEPKPEQQAAPGEKPTATPATVEGLTAIVDAATKAADGLNVLREAAAAAAAEPDTAPEAPAEAPTAPEEAPAEAPAPEAPAAPAEGTAE